MASGCKPAERNKTSPPRNDLRLERLEETGRLQFFYHCSSSSLPIRDLLRRRKTEPHIEKRAENYICKCLYWNNILPFLKSPEKYLFLFTTCKSSKKKFPEMSRYRERRFIVGYIKKENAPWRYDHYAVQGETKLVAFEDAMPIKALFRKPFRAVRLLGKDGTRRVLNRLKRGRNILCKCLDELKALKSSGQRPERCK